MLGKEVRGGRVEMARHGAAEASGAEVFLLAEVQTEEGPFSVAARRSAERLLT